MPRPKRIDLDLNDVDANSIFEDQTTAGAGSITLDGTDVTGGEWITPDGFAHQISLESAGNISGATFTVTGFEDTARHIALSEDITGPNATTVESSNYFAVITAITVDGAVGTNTEGGFVDEAITQRIPLNHWHSNVAINLNVTGTIDLTVQHTFDDVQDSTVTPAWQDHDDAALVNATTDVSGNYDFMPIAMRVKVNSYSSGAECAITVVESLS